VSGAATSPSPDSSIHGYCTPPALAEVIRDLYLDERTGVLVLSRSGGEKRITLDRGMILRVTSSMEDERLPAFLTGAGLITLEEAETFKGLDDGKVIDTITSRGRVPLRELQDKVRELTQQVLVSLFRWENLEYRFEEGAVSAGPLETNVVVSLELILRALRSMAAFAPIKEALVRQDRGLRFSDQLYLPFDQLRLNPIEGFLVSRVDGQSRVRDILAQTPPDEEDAASRFLFGLLILGLVQFIPPIGAGPLSCNDLVKGDQEKRQREERETASIKEFYALVLGGDPLAILGIDDGAGAEAVKAAYAERKERFAPSRFLKKVQAELREELQIIEARLLEAFLARRSSRLDAARPAAAGAERVVSLDLEALSMRKEMSKSDQQSIVEERERLSEQFFSKARDYWKMGDFFNCIRYCEFTTSYSDKNAAVFSLLGQALCRNPDYRWQKRAENALLRAAELEPFSPGHFVALGDFYKGHGLFAKARKHYEKALEILPSHAQARQALSELPQSSD